MFSAAVRHLRRAGVRQRCGLGAEAVIPFHQDAQQPRASLAVLSPGFLAEDSAMSSTGSARAIRPS